MWKQSHFHKQRCTYESITEQIMKGYLMFAMTVMSPYVTAKLLLYLIIKKNYTVSSDIIFIHFLDEVDFANETQIWW